MKYMEIYEIIVLVFKNGDTKFRIQGYRAQNHWAAPRFTKSSIILRLIKFWGA